jgi:translation elongation factor EF-Ts
MFPVCVFAVFQALARDIAALRMDAPGSVDLEKFKSEFKIAKGPKSSSPVAVGEAVKEMVATVGENCQLRTAVRSFARSC